MQAKETRIIVSLNPPEDIKALWLCGKQLKVFVNGKWEAISGGGNTEDAESLLNTEI